MKPSELELTPFHELKPTLQWVGIVLGCDVYADVKDDRNRDMIEKVLANALKQMDLRK